MLPPNHLYSAEIHNNTSKDVSVTVTYEDDQASETNTETLAPNSTKLFDVVNINRGSWESVRPIRQISLHSKENDVHVDHVPTVQGVHQKKVYNIEENENNLHLNDISQ